MKKILFFLLILVIVGVFALGYLGFIPGFSTLLGADRPKDLGIKYSEESKKSAVSKLQVVYEQLPASSANTSLVLTGSHAVDKSFSSEELTALADTRQTQYKYFPFKNVQIRVNADGSIEGSAILEFNTALSYLHTMGVSTDQVNKVVEKLSIVRGDLPVYLKGSGEIINNASQITVESAQIARINVPKGYINTYGPALNTLVDKVISSRRPNYDIRSLKIENGKIHFIGNSPDKESAIGK